MTEEIPYLVLIVLFFILKKIVKKKPLNTPQEKIKEEETFLAEPPQKVAPRKDPPKASSVLPCQETITKKPSTLRSSLKDPSSLRKAFILSEILQRVDGRFR